MSFDIPAIATASDEDWDDLDLPAGHAAKLQQAARRFCGKGESLSELAEGGVLEHELELNAEPQLKSPLLEPDPKPEPEQQAEPEIESPPKTPGMKSFLAQLGLQEYHSVCLTVSD